MRTVTAALTVAALAATLTGCGSDNNEPAPAAAPATSAPEAEPEPDSSDLPYDDDLAMYLYEDVVGIEADLEGSRELALTYCSHFDEMMSNGASWEEALGTLASAHDVDNYTQAELDTFTQILIISVNWQCPQYSDNLDV